MVFNRVKIQTGGSAIHVYCVSFIMYLSSCLFRCVHSRVCPATRPLRSPHPRGPCRLPVHTDPAVRPSWGRPAPPRRAAAGSHGDRAAGRLHGGCSRARPRWGGGGTGGTRGEREGGGPGRGAAAFAAPDSGCRGHLARNSHCGGESPRPSPAGRVHARATVVRGGGGDPWGSPETRPSEASGAAQRGAGAKGGGRGRGGERREHGQIRRGGRCAATAADGRPRRRHRPRRRRRATPPPPLPQ